MVKIVDMTSALQQVREKAPDTADAMKRFKSGNAGFTDKAHLKAKGMIPRADGTKKVSPKYESDAYDNQRYMMKKYMGQILARPDNSNAKDDKDHVYAPNPKIAKQLYSQGKKVYREGLNEKKADFLRLNFANNQTVKKAERWLYNNLGHSNPGYTSIIADKDSIEFQDMNDADSVMTKLKRAGFSFKVDMREDLDKKDVATIKPIIKQLQKSVKSHDKQAKQLAKDISDEKDLEEQKKDLEEQLKTAEKQLEELYIKEDKAYVIRFKRIKDKERMVVVFRNQNDADMYADNIKKQGGKVFSNKLEKIPYKVVDKK